MQIGLNLSKEYWKEIPEPLFKDGESIRFHENSLSRISQTPPVKAIYLLILDLRSFSSNAPFSSIKNVLYVGSSTDLRKDLETIFAEGELIILGIKFEIT